MAHAVSDDSQILKSTSYSTLMPGDPVDLLEDGRKLRVSRLLELTQLAEVGPEKKKYRRKLEKRAKIRVSGLLEPTLALLVGPEA